MKLDPVDRELAQEVFTNRQLKTLLAEKSKLELERWKTALEKGNNADKEQGCPHSYIMDELYVRGIFDEYYAPSIYQWDNFCDEDKDEFGIYEYEEWKAYCEHRCTITRDAIRKAVIRELDERKNAKRNAKKCKRVVGYFDFNFNFHPCGE